MKCTLGKKIIVWMMGPQKCCTSVVRSDWITVDTWARTLPLVSQKTFMKTLVGQC